MDTINRPINRLSDKFTNVDRSAGITAAFEYLIEKSASSRQPVTIGHRDFTIATMKLLSRLNMVPRARVVELQENFGVIPDAVVITN